MRIGVLEAKTRFSELIERAGKGEEIVVTKHGEPVARIEGVDRPMPAASLDALLNRVKARRATLGRKSETDEILRDRDSGRR